MADLAQPQTTPLAGDTARQAMDSMAGYDYQIIRTVEAWLQLGPDETIFIECGEDYDIVGQTDATATQVKSSPDNVTLNSKDVREAVRNFWALRERNAGRQRVSMRFLTRGSIGRERQSVLNEPGLTLWGKAADGDGDAARSLRDHLIGQGGSDSFLNFLRTANTAQLREELFSRIEWVTDEPSAEAARVVVNRLAVNMGRSSGTPPTICARAVPALLEHCRQTAVKKDSKLRSLALADAQLIFEQQTSLPMPITEGLMATLGAMMTAGADARTLSFAPSFDGELPELPIECMPRADYINELESRIRARGAILVVGAEGEGKSTAANLLARRLGGNGCWMDLRGGDENISAAAIENAIVLARGANRPSCLVLDDVPAAQGVPDLLWGRLRILIDTCRRSGIPLAMTSKGVPADAVDPKFAAAGVSAVPVPRISEAELIGYIESLGCRSDASESWARMTLAHTGSGHPKLVHLAALELRDRGWVARGVEDIVQAPRSVQEARVAARQHAAKSVQQPERELLFALTLTTSPFSRDVALRLAAGLKIGEPGAAFDRLDGRWVERVGQTLYRATPLLQGQAEKIWEAATVTHVHGLFFDAYIATKSISLSQAMTVFLHAWQSKDARRMGGFVTSLSLRIEKTEGLAEALEVLVHFGGQDGERAIAFDSKASLLLRYLQFRVARARRPELLPDIARRWLWEINQESDPVFRALNLGMRGMSMAVALEGELAADVLLDGLGHADSLLRLLEAQGERELSPNALDGEDPMKMLFVVAQSTFRTKARVAEILDALEHVPDAFRARLLNSFDLAIIRGGLGMFDQALVAEHQSTAPDWMELSRILERAAALGRQWSAKAFEESAARVLSIVLAEHIRDPESALRVLQEVGDSDRRLNIKEQIANVAFAREDYEEASRLWNESLLGGAEAGDGGVRDPFAMRKAGIACAKRGRFDDAARWFDRAGDLADAELKIMPPALFQIDASQCWFRHGAHAEALHGVGTVWLQVNRPIDPQEDARLYAAQRFLGNLAGWMLGVIDSSRHQQPVIWIGGASRPDIDLDAVRAEPATPLDLLGGMLARLAFTLDADMPGVGEAIALAEASSDPITEIMYRTSKLAKLLRESQFVAVALEVKAIMEAAARHGGSGEEGAASIEQSIEDLARYAFAFPLAITTMSGAGRESLLRAWAEALVGEGVSKTETLMREVAGKFELGNDDAMSLARTSSDWLRRIAAASLALSGGALPPRDLAHAQWALGFNLIAPEACKFLRLELRALADIFAAEWEGALATPALLNAPRISAPALREAIDCKDSAPRRLLRLAHASAQACGESLPPFIAAALREAVARQESTEQRLRDASKVH
jgi:tetratricopeptide (TPR) repeat protein